jgi:mannose/fructose/N-acetylgalactosamine-specific phosphotransferase system component IIC
MVLLVVKVVKDFLREVYENNLDMLAVEGRIVR